MIGIGLKVLVVLHRKVINSELHRDRCLKPNLKRFKNRILVQDGAKAHTSELIKAYMAKQGVVS